MNDNFIHFQSGMSENCFDFTFENWVPYDTSGVFSDFMKKAIAERTRERTFIKENNKADYKSLNKLEDLLNTIPYRVCVIYCHVTNNLDRLIINF